MDSEPLQIPCPPAGNGADWPSTPEGGAGIARAWDGHALRYDVAWADNGPPNRLTARRTAPTLGSRSA